MSFRLTLILFVFTSLQAEARNWTVIRKEQTAIGCSIFVDAGSRDRVKPNSRLCVLTPEKDIIACAAVAFLRPSVSAIKVEESLYAQIQVGALVRVDGEEDAIKSPSLWRNRMSLRQISPILQSIIYGAPRLNEVARVDPRVDTWLVNDTVRSGAWGLAFSLSNPINNNWAVSPGIFLTLNNRFEERTQFGLISNRSTINSVSEGAIYGARFDVDYKILQYHRIQIQAGSGFALQRGVVEVQASYTNNRLQTKIAEYKAALLALALEPSFELQYGFGDFLLVFASRWSLPVKTLADTYEGSTNFDNANLAEANYRVKALRSAVNLRTSKGRFLELGLAFAF